MQFMKKIEKLDKIQITKKTETLIQLKTKTISFKSF